MRAFVLAVLALGSGCASSKFDVAESPSADTGIEVGAADTFLIDDTTPPGRPDADADDVQVVDASGPPCVTIDDCKPGDYCERPNCGVVEGRCRPYVTVSTFAPVCACDGVTYWNRAYANLSDAIVAEVGRCKPGAGKACDREFCATPDTICVREQGSSACSSPTGLCWKVPSDATCGATPGVSVSVCGEGVCLSHCDAVLNRKSFYLKSCTF